MDTLDLLKCSSHLSLQVTASKELQVLFWLHFDQKIKIKTGQKVSAHKHTDDADGKNTAIQIRTRGKGLTGRFTA